jgi:chemotaxis protein histidine kinase CheA
VGGEGKIESKKGRGTTIIVDIPLVNKEMISHGKN